MDAFNAATGKEDSERAMKLLHGGWHHVEDIHSSGRKEGVVGRLVDRALNNLSQSGGSRQLRRFK